MGKKKKRKRKKKKEFWCFYCDRRFNDEKVLTQHQRAKHFKCDFCGKKLTSANGLKIHCYKIHRQQLIKVPNAKPGRDSFKYEIWGMQGIPAHFLQNFKEDDDGDDKSTKKRKLNSDTTSTISGLGLQKSTLVNTSNVVGNQTFKPPVPNEPQNTPVIQSDMGNKNKVFMIWNDEDVSMEEKRAEMSQYVVVN